MKEIFKQLILFFTLATCFLPIVAQNVTNVNANQVGTAIHITYDLDRAADISVYVSTDGGKNYTRLYRVRGDVGKTIGPGQKTIVWDVQSEMEELNSDDIRFKVKVDANAEAAWRKQLREEAKEEKMAKETKKVNESKGEKKVFPYSTFFTLNMAYSPLPQWSWGVKVGGVKKVGWFVNLMTNFNFKGWGNYLYEGRVFNIIDSKTIRFSAQAGLVYRPCKPVSLLFGLGYGYRTLTYNAYYYQDDWLCYPNRTFEGVDVSLGLMFHIKGFALSAEAVTTNFQTIETRIGVGFCLPHKKQN